MSISFGWNFFSYSVSSTRTEMECLDKILDYMRSTQPKEITYRMDPLPNENVHPVCTVEPAKTVVVKKKKKYVAAKKNCK